MTVVKCVKCGVELHYTLLVFAGEDEDKGLCESCLEVELRKFVFDKGLMDEFAKRMEEAFGIKDGNFTV